MTSTKAYSTTNKLNLSVKKGSVGNTSLNGSQTPMNQTHTAGYNSLLAKASTITPRPPQKGGPSSIKANIKKAAVTIDTRSEPKTASIKNYVSSTPKTKLHMSATLKSKTINKSPLRSSQNIQNQQ